MAYRPNRFIRIVFGNAWADSVTRFFLYVEIKFSRLLSNCHANDSGTVPPTSAKCYFLAVFDWMRRTATFHFVSLRNRCGNFELRIQRNDLQFLCGNSAISTAQVCWKIDFPLWPCHSEPGISINLRTNEVVSVIIFLRRTEYSQ